MIPCIPCIYVGGSYRPLSSVMIFQPQVIGKTHYLHVVFIDGTWCRIVGEAAQRLFDQLSAGQIVAGHVPSSREHLTLAEVRRQQEESYQTKKEAS